MRVPVLTAGKLLNLHGQFFVSMMGIVMLLLSWVALRIQAGDTGKACGTLPDT